MNVEDSYVRNYKEVARRKYSTRKAFHIKRRNRCLSMRKACCTCYVNLAELKKVGKSYGVSITKFLAAALIWAIYQEYEEAGTGGPVDRDQSAH